MSFVYKEYSGYINHVIWTLVPVILILLVPVVFFSGNELLGWKALVFFYILTGYVHFIIGFIYQSKSLLRKNSISLYMFRFILPNLILLVGAYYIINSIYYLYFFLFVILYFLMHGFLNERTIFNWFTGKILPNTFLFYILLTLIFAKSLEHKSVIASMFVSKEAYLTVTNSAFVAPQIFSTMELGLMAASIIFYVLFLVLHILKQDRDLTTTVFLAVSPILFIIILFIPPLSFIFLLAFILIFHFIQWIVFSYFQIKEKKEGMKTYLLSTSSLFLILIIIFIVGALNLSSFTITVYQIVYDTNVFLVATFLHITSSFFNEPWLKSFLGFK